LIAQAARHIAPCWLANSHRIASGLADTANDGLEREFKSLKQLKGHCARCVHREIKQNRKKANVAASSPVRVPTNRRPKIIGGDLAQGSIRGMNGYVLVAQGGHSQTIDVD